MVPVGSCCFVAKASPPVGWCRLVLAGSSHDLALGFHLQAREVHLRAGAGESVLQLRPIRCLLVGEEKGWAGSPSLARPSPRTLSELRPTAARPGHR